MGKFILDYYNWHGIFYIRVPSVFWFLGGFGNDKFIYLKQKNFQQKVL
jgi:hypothetical protein